jgi:GST-like protein
MITLYYWPTPNGWKISIALEELDLPYELKVVNILKGEQFDPAFLEINPNNKIPAIVDDNGADGTRVALFESGAILNYLAEKTGKLLPSDPVERHHAIQWLMFQMGGLGPMMGQANHFRIYATVSVPYAVDRYTNEVRRLYGVMNRHLADRSCFAGASFSIADIAMIGWVNQRPNMGIELGEFPHVDRWFAEMTARPGVRRGLAAMAEDRTRRPTTDAEREILFGARQFQTRGRT